MDVGQEKNLPVYGVNQLRENEHCVNTTNDNYSFSLNSMTATNLNLSDTCPKSIGHIRRIPSKSSTRNIHLINGISCCDTREKQELRGINATEISKKQNDEASGVENDIKKREDHIQLREDQTDVLDDERKRLQELIIENKEVFSKSEYDIGKFVDKNGKSDPIKIEIKNVNVQINVPPRRVAFAHREWLSEHLIKLEENGVIEKVTGETGPCWNSPILIVPKGNTTGDKDAKRRYRKCIDLRAVNDQVIPETYPLPNTRDCLVGMENARYFTTIGD